MACRYNLLNRLSLVLLLTFALVGLAGCQSATEKDWIAFCKNNEWASHGYFDATNGFSIQMLRAYKERCGDDISRKEEKLYQQGFLKGIKEFCTLQNGYNIGHKNEKNPRTCPPELAKEFNAGFKSGLGDYLKEEDVKRLLKEQRERKETEQSEMERRQQIGGPGFNQ